MTDGAMHRHADFKAAVREVLREELLQGALR